jgi:hypothetical protein
MANTAAEILVDTLAQWNVDSHLGSSRGWQQWHRGSAAPAAREIRVIQVRHDESVVVQPL